MNFESYQRDPDKYYEGDRSFFRPDLRPCYLVSQRLEPIDEAVMRFALDHRLIVLKNIGRWPSRAVQGCYRNGSRTVDLTCHSDPRMFEDLDSMLFNIVLTSARRCDENGTWSRVSVWKENLSIDVVRQDAVNLFTDGWTEICSWNWPECPASKFDAGRVTDWNWQELSQ